MKKLALFTGALLALAVALGSCGGEKKQDKLLRHVVMFGFKPEVTAGNFLICFIETVYL